MADNATPMGNQLVSFFEDVPKKHSDKKPIGVELLPIAQANSFTFQGPAVAGIVYVSHPEYPRELAISSGQRNDGGIVAVLCTVPLM